MQGKYMAKVVSVQDKYGKAPFTPSNRDAPKELLYIHSDHSELNAVDIDDPKDGMVVL